MSHFVGAISFVDDLLQFAQENMFHTVVTVMPSVDVLKTIGKCGEMLRSEFLTR